MLTARLSGGACALGPFFAFSDRLQSGKAIGPHLVEERRHVAEPFATPSIQAAQANGPNLVEERRPGAGPFGTASIQAAIAIRAGVDEPFVGQPTQMLRGRGSAHRREMTGDLTGGQLAIAQQTNDGATRRV